MKWGSIEWEEDDKGVNAVRCPVCQQAWRHEDDDELYGCKHLQFVWGDGGLQDLGDFDLEQLRADYLKTRTKVAADDEDSEDLDDERNIFDDAPDWDVLGEIETKVVDEICELTESGIACGPVSFTTYFGIKHEKSIHRAKRPAKA